MLRWFMLVALVASPAVAATQDSEQVASAPPERIRNVQVVGDEPCPKAVGEEIVVCARIDQEDLYRIPKKLRKAKYHPASTAWAARAETVSEVNRIGLPNSCSPVGTGGQTGCTMQFIQQSRAARRADDAAARAIP
ncbi:hypothetical protein [Sphingomonas japonica]|uniref:DUF4189 domain-containing protein n=1 Tax=Sphingomonas japonica TaxID=511662 RepID=A0ABX0U202_9SPHN|nr:hypothetical protein [Sphingomonas japonica]NIJ24593.1 hypothetical protein [Sphingomonas japonica]